MPNRYTYRLLYASFFISVLCCFFYLRPLNSPWHRFIAGDGLGYYAYLPATFIYQDQDYIFHWFNKVFETEYNVIATSPGVEHFTTRYKDRLINKYYPGLCILWLPFFAMAHLCALVFQYPANGYSLPYQWGMGAASLFYLFLGLYYLRKLLFRFYGKAWLASVVPILIFYGTALFDYAINMNSLSHVYSFSLITAFLYFLYRFFNEDENKPRLFFLALFLLLFIITIRPLNVLVLLLVPALQPKSYKFTRFFGFNFQSWIWSLPLLLLLVLQLYLLKRSTGEIFPNTYTGEPFYFLNPQFKRALFDFQYGLFLYTPLILFALPGVFFIPSSGRSYFLLLGYLFYLYLYSCWWFWPITSRATVDVMVVPAILLGGWFSRFSIRSWPGRYLLLLGTVLMLYFQFKSYQFRNGILDRNNTDASLYVKNFFKWRPGLVYAVAPSSVLKQEVKEEGFETGTYPGNTSTNRSHGGQSSIKLDLQNHYSKEIEAPWPEFMSEAGIPKIRLSFWLFAEDQMKEGQVYVNFLDRSGKQLQSLPFYLKQKEMGKNRWSYLEMGHEFSVEEAKTLGGSKVSVFFWNNAGTNSLYIDDFRLEFFLCDRSAEIVP